MAKKHHHPRPGRKLHEHEYHSPAQIAFNRVFVAPAIQGNPMNNTNDPDHDGDNDAGDTDNDSGT
jgi:hypothetical protein